MEPLIFWAKSGDSEHPEGHPLLGHMLDAAAAAVKILQREPASTRAAYARDFGLASEQDALELAGFIVGLHDLGKASAIFQVQWPEGWQRVAARGLGALGFCLPDRSSENWVAHGVISVILVRKCLPAMGFAPAFTSAVAELLGAHHGFLALPEEEKNGLRMLDCETGPWNEARKALLQAYQETLRAPLPLSERLDPAGQLRLMGLASFADWLASSPDYFPYGRSLNDPRAFYEESLELAEKALDAVNWLPRKPLAEKPPRFEDVFFSNPTGVQRAVIEALEEARGPQVLVLEAPMGGGKTEAAFYAHLKLQAQNRHRGLYVAMPTTATGNAMFERVKRDLLEKLKQPDRPIDLQLVHGASFLNTSYLELKNVGDPGERGEVAASEWFSAKKRAMLTEYGVGTVDQALLGVLRVRHHFVRLWGLGNRTAVLDEVHAYDAYTSRLIEGLVRWLAALGSSVVIMSATLTRAQRRGLLAAASLTPPESEAPYPRITAGQPGEAARSLAVARDETKRIDLTRAPRKVDEVAGLIEARLSQGGVAAAVVNTVDRAQALYRAFSAGEPLYDPSGHLVGKRVGELDVYLFHARYPSEERQWREQNALRLFGKEGQRPKKAVLIATQVVEQSLDLDFDLMYTDLAPADLVLQRAGRLHRHEKTPRPPTLQSPKLYVGGLAEDPPDLESDFWNRVYQPFPLLTTWHVLRQKARLTLPDDIEPLVEAAYSQATIQALSGEARAQIEEAVEEWYEATGAMRLKAEDAAVDPPERLLDLLAGGLAAAELHLDDDEESPLTQVPLTRLGDPSVTAVPTYRVGGELYLDARQKEPLPISQSPDPNAIRRIYERSVKVGRKGVYYRLKESEIPESWQNHALLRNLRVLELSPAGDVWFGKTQVRLDPELGLVYERH